MFVVDVGGILSVVFEVGVLDVCNGEFLFLEGFFENIGYNVVELIGLMEGVVDEVVEEIVDEVVVFK